MTHIFRTSAAICLCISPALGQKQPDFDFHCISVNRRAAVFETTRGEREIVAVGDYIPGSNWLLVDLRTDADADSYALLTSACGQTRAVYRWLDLGPASPANPIELTRAQYDHHKAEPAVVNGLRDGTIKLKGR